MTGQAVVFGAGGDGWAGWQLGMLVGLDRAGAGLRTPDLVVGTSTGALVAALVYGDAGPAAAVRTVRRVGTWPVTARQSDYELVDETRRSLRAGGATSSQAGVQLGRLALAADPSDAAVSAMADLLRDHRWPSAPRLLVTAVDADSGQLVAWDSTAGIALPRAVAASCALPGVTGPVAVDGRRYVSGAVRSTSNPDLAAGAATVMVLADGGPAEVEAAAWWDRPAAGCPATLVFLTPDATARAAFTGDPDDPVVFAAALAAGERQSSGYASQVRARWGTSTEHGGDQQQGDGGGDRGEHHRVAGEALTALVPGGEDEDVLRRR
ncbi:NTE family protein [Micromonospora sp. Llam0]|nr:NTE family protein [Micromonospora sp. Llam0]